MGGETSIQGGFWDAIKESVILLQEIFEKHPNTPQSILDMIQKFWGHELELFSKQKSLGKICIIFLNNQIMISANPNVIAAANDIQFFIQQQAPSIPSHIIIESSTLH